MTMADRSHITRFGLPGIDRIPYGMHACHVYRNRDELIGALLPYFLTGLSGKERCLWVTAPPLPAREAYQALRTHGVEEAIQDGAMLILDFDQWYGCSAGLKGHDVVQLWLTEEERALADGYHGLRIAGNTSFVRPSDWSTFIEYEQAVTAHLQNRRIVALCSYALGQRNDQQASEILQAHHFALQGSDADWEWGCHAPISSHSETGL